MKVLQCKIFKMKIVKKFIGKIYKNCTSIICIVLALFSLWVIIVVGLNLPYLIPSIFDSDININLNTIFLNLSYSYIAGCIFYFFTSYLPNLIRMKKIKSGIKIKIGEMDRAIQDMFYAFNRGNAENFAMDVICKNKEICIKVLMSKDWNSIIEEEAKYFHYTTTYLSRICNKHKELKKAINCLIDTYKEYLSAEQLTMCEEIRGAFLMYRFELDSSFNVKYSQRAMKETSENIYEELQKILKFKKSISRDFSHWNNYVE